MSRAPHTLVITNDFPPRDGGIQTFVYELVSRLDPSTVTVLASSYPGDVQFDKTLDFRVVRAHTKTLLPTRKTASLARQLVAETGATRVLFGASAPLALLSPHLRRVGVTRIVAMSHGHEAGWALTPGTRTLLKRIGNSVDVVTYLGEFTRNKIGRVFDQQARTAMRRLAPAVDPEVFTPANRNAATALMQKHQLGGKRIIVCISRLMERKGQDQLIKAMPGIVERIPNAQLVIVGGGSFEAQLRSLAVASPVARHITFTGKVPTEELPLWYAGADVFAMPCRTRNAGWDVEGLGIVYLEASASGISVIAGDSGGAPDAVLEGETGFVVNGRSLREIQDTIVKILSDQSLAQALGRRGREWVLSAWTWEHAVKRLNDLLDGRDPDA